MVTAIPAPLRPILDSQASRLSTLHTHYSALFAAHGPQHWWPGRTRFEIIVGAILTQNTSWKNVERAIANLRAAKLLSPAAVRAVCSATLAKHVRPSGYFRQKAKSLKSFVAFLYENHGGSLNRLFATSTELLRDQLLAVRGIGPETADSILLYAGKHPVFVVDAYSRRILERHNLLPAEVQTNSRRSYEQIRSLFESQLPRDPQLFNEFHALIVQTGKLHCRKSNPLCSNCPLSRFLPASHHLSTSSDRSPVTNHQSRITLP
jgi:endonuclease III related protein